MIRPLLYTLSTLDSFCFVLVITTATQFVYSLGGSQFFLGVLDSTSALINLLWNPIIGSLSDNFGRKRILMYCLMVCLVGNTITSMSTTLGIFFVARILTNFACPIGTLIKSLIDDNIQDQTEKMTMINRLQAIGGVCFIIGSLTSGFLTENPNGYQTIFRLICTLMAVNLILVTFLPNQQASKKSLDLKSVLKNFTNINWGKYWDIWLVKLSVDFVFTVFHFNLTSILMKRFGLSGKLFGYVFASISILTIAMSLALPVLKRKFYRSDSGGFKRLFHGLLAMFVAVLGQSLSPNFALYYLFLIPISMGRIFFDTTFTEVILNRADANEKGKILGTFENTIALSGLMAPLISGVIADQWGVNTAIFLCTIPLSAVIILTYKKQKLKL